MLVPMIGMSIQIQDIIRTFFCADTDLNHEELKRELSVCIQQQDIHVTSSGIAAFYLILESLKKLSCRREVIIPAYTAGSLVVAIQKAGLKPVLADVSLDDFSIDTESVLNIVNKNTLAVVCVHMFGIPSGNTPLIKQKLPGEVFLIEDCAQAMGSTIGRQRVGNFGDMSFFSFNRGKNVSFCGGGCIADRRGSVSPYIGAVLKKYQSPQIPGKEIVRIARVLLLYAALKPAIYHAGYPFISLFKENRPPKKITPGYMSNCHAGLGLRQLQKADELFFKRSMNGSFLYDTLRQDRELILFRTSKENILVFNRFPVLFRDPLCRQTMKKKLWHYGIESSLMYGVPLHRMFDLGYEKEAFPNANFVAAHLLALPVHPGVRKEHLMRMVDTIRYP